MGGRGSITANATRPAISREAATNTITGPNLSVGTRKWLRERNNGTARANYLSHVEAAIAAGQSLETVDRMGDINESALS